MIEKILLLTLMFAYCWGFPIDNESDNPAQQIIKFMRKYGYLEKRTQISTGPESEALYREDAIVEGIKKVQKFGAIPQTGNLDEETIKLINSPRCGVADVENSVMRRKRYVIGSTNWQKRKITYFIANWSNKVPHEEISKKMELAFDAWSKYSNLRFARVNDTSADIIVAFGRGHHGDNYPFDGPGNVLAHAFYPYEENSYGGDIHFDEDENWLEGAQSLSDGVDFLSVAVHELGHSLGLAHSPVWSSIMFPYYKGLTPAQLDYDDILAMYHLYIQRNIQDESSFESVTQEITSEIPTDEHESEEVNERNEITTVSTKIDSEVNESENDSAVSEEDSEDVPEDEAPLVCSGSIDAISLINNKIYIFKQDTVWVLSKNLLIENGYPKQISEVFPNLPERFKQIDAAYEQTEIESATRMVYLFSGQEYVSYDFRGPLYNGPYPISRFVNSPDVDKVDAAFIWGRNNKTYLFSHSQYWRFNQEKIMDPQYPKPIEKWRGLPENLDGALTLADGNSYFFKGKYYWQFNNEFIRPEKGYPRKISTLLPLCF